MKLIRNSKFKLRNGRTFKVIEHIHGHNAGYTFIELHNEPITTEAIFRTKEQMDQLIQTKAIELL